MYENYGEFKITFFFSIPYHNYVTYFIKMRMIYYRIQHIIYNLIT